MEGTKEPSLWGKLPLKTKIIIIGIAIGAVSIILFLLVIITPLMSLGIIDIEDIGSSGGGVSFSNIDTANSFLWPVGSNETEEHDGALFAIGDPACTYVSSNFGKRNDPHTGAEGDDHGGVDITSEVGIEPGVINIIAAKDGTVTYPTEGAELDCPSSTVPSECGDGYGNYVIIRHSDGTETLYGHLYENSITVKNGDTVKGGQVIGKMGTSGNSTGTHLHFEVRVNGDKVDPLNYISEENPRPKKQTSTFIEGNENVQTICLTLKANGYSDVAVAAIMGNMEKESNFDPKIVNEIGCVGIVQWCDRKSNLISRYGNEWDILENQIEFVLYELDNSESAAKSYLNDSSIEVRTMAHKFCNGYERPGTDVCNQTDPNHDRMGAAETLLPYVQNGCK